MVNRRCFCTACIFLCVAANNAIMNMLLIKMKKLYHTLSYPLSITAVILLAVGVISIIPVAKFSELAGHINSNLSQLLCVLLPGFIVYNECKNVKGSIMVSAFVLLLNMCCYGLLGWQLSIVIIVACTFLLLLGSRSDNVLLNAAAMLMLTVALLLLFFILHRPISSVISSLAAAIGSRGTLFALFENPLDLLLNSKFSSLIYFTDYSTAQIIDEKIVSGVINVFKADTANPSVTVARLLTGKYYVNIFITVGMYLYIFKRVGRRELNCITLLALLSVAFGNSTLFAFFILLYNPILYFAYLAVSGLSYLISSLVDIRIGFVGSASVFELIRYGNRWVYFILIGFVIGFISYLSAMIVNTKYPFQDKKIYPKEVKVIIGALGGGDNIERLTANRVIVKNPNLIDIIKLDCDVHQNEIKLLYDDFDLLKKYY